MKKFLPKTNNNPKGFTLIELLVVISIIAILTIIAISVYSGVQRKARDSRRQAEIDSLAKSLEAVKDAKTGTYTYTTAQYSKDYPKVTPKDPQSATISYCINKGAASAPPPDSATWNSLICGPGYSAIPIANTADIITNPIPSWTICAQLEVDPTQVFCKSSLTN